jgi:hypothetical protein
MKILLGLHPQKIVKSTGVFEEIFVVIQSCAQTSASSEYTFSWDQEYLLVVVGCQLAGQPVQLSFSSAWLASQPGDTWACWAGWAGPLVTQKPKPCPKPTQNLTGSYMGISEDNDFDSLAVQNQPTTCWVLGCPQVSQPNFHLVHLLASTFLSGWLTYGKTNTGLLEAWESVMESSLQESYYEEEESNALINF